MDFTLKHLSLINTGASLRLLKVHKLQRSLEGAIVSYAGDLYNILMFSAFLSMVTVWWGLEYGRQQPCVNCNHVVSIMCLKLSLRNQSALGGLQANQHFCRWKGWTGWLAAYSVYQWRIEEKLNAALLQTHHFHYWKKSLICYCNNKYLSILTVWKDITAHW